MPSRISKTSTTPTSPERLISIGVRGVDEDVWLAFRADCVRKGKKVRTAVTETMGRDIRRMAAEDRERPQ